MVQASGAASGARQVANSETLERVARVGYVISGLLHLLIGWLALQLALGDSEGSADQSGALQQISGEGLGQAVLWVGVVGFAALGLWQLTEAVWGSRETSDRAKAAAKGVVYLVLAWTTFGFARGGGSDSGEQSSDITSRLLEAPAGQVLVGAIGLGIVGVGGYHVYKGVKRKFLEDLEGGTSGQLGSAVIWLAIVGYVTKGIALGIVGALFVLAAVQSDPSEATGLDGALRTLREQPAGPVLLALVAVGLAAYGLYSFARARYARM